MQPDEQPRLKRALRQRGKRDKSQQSSHSQRSSSYKEFDADSTLSMKERLPQDRETLARQALMKLQDSFYPDHLICRDEQEMIIREFVLKGIRNKGSSSSLCTAHRYVDISGVPGIGKTALVRKVVEHITKDPRKRSLATASYYINCLELKKPEELYRCMLSRLFRQNQRSTAKALTRLNKLLLQDSNNVSEVRVLIVDELDFLLTKDQSVLYNLFEWTQHKKSRLVVLAIANTMNLPEKLKPRVVSRIGEDRVVFRQYTSEQIEKIILHRLDHLPIFQEHAVIFASKKIATCSSDIRRIMAVLCRSVEIALKESEQSKVTIEHVKEAFHEFFDSPIVRFIGGMGPFLQLCLILVFLQLKHSENATEECTVTAIHRRLTNTAYPCAISRLIFVFGQLEALNLVKTREQPVCSNNNLLVRPNIAVEDIRNADLHPSCDQYREAL